MAPNQAEAYGGGGGGGIHEALHGRLLSEVQLLTLLYTIFDRIDNPFEYLP